MKLFHTHNWKEIAKTYVAPHSYPNAEATGGAVDELAEQYKIASCGLTTILWECQDKTCKKLRKEEMLGKEVK